MTVTRLSDEPIIHSGMSDTLGDNINGPSLIRVPDWVPNPLGRYYLYFAHHKGRFIRMAYADAVTGPWTIHEPGVLHVENSLFVTEDLDDLIEPTGVWTRATGGTFLYAHVASPDVHIDHAAQTLRMYFHGLLPDGEQRTRLATSTDGLTWTPRAPILGTPYFRAFEHSGFVYAIAWAGALYRARAWEGPFEAGPQILKDSALVDPATLIRHVAIQRDEDTLDLIYTRIGDSPECLLRARVDLSPSWEDWKPGPPRIILSPEREWEGADLPLSGSAMGAASGPENALRDPCLFTDDGVTYLLYCGAGESAIGLATMA